MQPSIPFSTNHLCHSIRNFLPLPQICFSTEGTFGIILKPSSGWCYLFCDKRCELSLHQHSMEHSKLAFAESYFALLEVWRHNICPDFIPLNYIPSVLCMSTRRASSGTLIIPFVCLLRTKGMSGYPFHQALCGLHDCD